MAEEEQLAGFVISSDVNAYLNHQRVIDSVYLAAGIIVVFLAFLFHRKVGKEKLPPIIVPKNLPIEAGHVRRRKDRYGF